MDKGLKNIFKIYGMLIILLGLCLMFIPFKNVEAKEEKVDYKASVISEVLEGDTAFALEDSGMDENLYVALVEIYNEAKGIPAGSIEYVDHLRTKMFLEDDVNITSLDLSGKNISSLSNFNWMYFKESVVELKLDNNSLTEIVKKSASHPLYKIAPNLTTLSISNNDLDAIDLSVFTKLTNLNLSNNNLDAIDLSGLNTSENEVLVDLTVNAFDSYDEIKFPKDADLINKLTINFMGNNLPDKTNTFSQIDLILALQGANSSNITKVTTVDDIYYYKTGIQDLMLVVTLDDSNVAPIIIYDNQVEDKVNLVSQLGVGIFTAYYSTDTSTFQSLYNSNNVTTFCYKPQTFTILPTTPTFKLELDGELKELKEIEELDKPAILRLYSQDENADIYYKMPNSQEWIKGNSVEITRGGTYTIEIKSVVKNLNGEEVESAYSYALIRGRLNLYVPNVVLLLIIAAFAILFFAVALPLIKKYVMHR